MQSRRSADLLHWVAGIRKGPPQTPDEVFGLLETIPCSVLPGIPASDLLRAFLKGDYYATVFEAQAKGDKALDPMFKGLVRSIGCLSGREARLASEGALREDGHLWS
jgi:hypothetical protein